MGRRDGDAQRRASARYERDHVERLRFKCYPADADVFERLQSEKVENGGEGMGAYIRRLVREDMERDGE